MVDLTCPLLRYPLADSGGEGHKKGFNGKDDNRISIAAGIVC